MIHLFVMPLALYEGFWNPKYLPDTGFSLIHSPAARICFIAVPNISPAYFADVTSKPDVYFIGEIVSDTEELPNESVFEDLGNFLDANGFPGDWIHRNTPLQVVNKRVAKLFLLTQVWGEPLPTLDNQTEDHRGKFEEVAARKNFVFSPSPQEKIRDSISNLADQFNDFKMYEVAI